MRIEAVNTGHFKLDGGAMFGVVPKSIWNKLNKADENNMCSWAMRCMLVEDGGRIILIDNGIGDKQSEKFFGYYYLHGEDSLNASLHKLGISSDDITDVFLTHLHFDHCGGSIRWNNAKTAFEPTFKNATYWSHKDHWSHAMDSNPREKASFLSENIVPILESGQLQFVPDNNKLTDNFEFKVVNGHTNAMMVPIVSYKDTKFAFCADLIPSAAHIPVNYVMAYDIRPLDSMNERLHFLNEAVDNNYTLFFEHDPVIECAKVERNERGVFLMKQNFSLKEALQL